MEGKILIIDDDKMISDAYLMKLQKSGLIVESIQDGKLALEKIEETEPDIVLMDVAMYPMSGLDILKALQERPIQKRPKVVLLTNVEEQESIDAAYRLGAVDYLIKAKFTPTEVLKRVEAILQKQ